MPLQEKNPLSNQLVHNVYDCYPIGCPRILRTDMGTENSILAVIQPMLRHTGTDTFAGAASHRYGRSPSNQVCWSMC